MRTILGSVIFPPLLDKDYFLTLACWDVFFPLSENAVFMVKIALNLESWLKWVNRVPGMLGTFGFFHDLGAFYEVSD